MTNSNQTRSTAPKFSALDAGVVASSACALALIGGASANIEEYSAPECNVRIEANDIVDTVQIPIQEEWDKERHGKELNDLIVKKAVSASGRLGKQDSLRLDQLQRMRRETFPLPMSYEEFIKDRDREIALDNLIEMFAEFRRKYVSNG